MARDVTTLNIEITAEDKASSVLSNIGSTIKTGLVVAVGVATAALAGLAAAFRAGIPAAIEQEDALKKLSNALADLGPASVHVTEALTAQAEALQKTTKFSDDAIENGQAFAAAFIKNGDALQSVTQSAVDLASGLGLDLQTAFELLTKAAQGNTSTFSRYGLVLDENIPKGEKLAAIQQLIADRFGGRAQADVKTFSGALSQLGSAWGEVLEAIGDAVIKNDAVVGTIKRLTAALFEAAPKVGEFATALVKLAGETLPTVTRGFQGFGAFLTTFALATSLAAEGLIKMGRAFLFVQSFIPGLGSKLDGARAALKALDDGIDPFQQKAAKLAGELGRAALGLDDLADSAGDAAPGVDNFAKVLGALADNAARTGPAFTTYRTAADLARASTEGAGGAFDGLEQSTRDVAAALDGSLSPALDRAAAKAAQTQSFIEGVLDRSGRLIANVSSISADGTRANLQGGGSRLIGSTGGTSGGQTRTSGLGSKTYIYDPTFGRVEKFG